jgi:hypothetical protein
LFNLHGHHMGKAARLSPAASPPAILIGGNFGGECARCFGSISQTQGLPNRCHLQPGLSNGK